MISHSTHSSNFCTSLNKQSLVQIYGKNMFANLENSGKIFFLKQKKAKCRVCVKLRNIPQRMMRQRWMGMNAPFTT